MSSILAVLSSDMFRSSFADITLMLLPNTPISPLSLPSYFALKFISETSSAISESFLTGLVMPAAIIYTTIMLTSKIPVPIKITNLLYVLIFSCMLSMVICIIICEPSDRIPVATIYDILVALSKLCTIVYSEFSSRIFFCTLGLKLMSCIHLTTSS